MQHVDIGVFAHNEEATIAGFLADLSGQSLLSKGDVSVRISVLCNGCSDRTEDAARRAMSGSDALHSATRIFAFSEPGKARTWNRFIESLDSDSDYVIFADGDIRISGHTLLEDLLEDLRANDAVAVTSRPIKKLGHIRWNVPLRLAAKLIARPHRDGPIAGSLYAAKAESVRRIRLPVPCLVEDGFLSACLVTGLFSHDGEPERVKASSRASHQFEAPGTLREFFKHDVRLALGSELNAALFTDLWAAGTEQARIEVLEEFSQSRGIEESIAQHLRHPERSALRGGAKIWERGVGRFTTRVIKLPIRVLYACYMWLVKREARRLFRSRKFHW
jgi:hypothetical protein